MKSLGLMSGTSLDGVDIALLDTDGHRVQSVGPAATYAYDKSMQDALRALINRQDDADILYTERQLTLKHVEAVQTFLAAHALSAQDIDVIGFHGQTIEHRPDEGLTWQIGDGAFLAEHTGIDVVYDFRRRDVAAGGQGAPLVPVYHQAIVEDLALPVAIVNIGGVSNVTWIGSCDSDDNDNIVAFDTGPGNALLNDWVYCNAMGACFDRDGKLAASGVINEAIVSQYLDDPYFHKIPPKSLDRNHFSLSSLDGMTTEDGAATLAAFTVQSIVAALEHLPSPTRWLIAGGGRHNPTIMQLLQASLDAPVDPIDTIGFDGDALEAQAFAFLAVRSLQGLPLTFPGTTGVKHPTIGGSYQRA